MTARTRLRTALSRARRRRPPHQQPALDPAPPAEAPVPPSAAALSAPAQAGAPQPPAESARPAPLGHAAQGESGSSRAGWPEFVGAVGSLLSLFTAVLFYFGWASSDAETRALGVRDTLFHLSTADYLLRSVGALFMPTLLTAAAALAATGGHHWVEREPARAARVLRPLRYAWAVLPAALGLLAVSPDVFNVVMPVAILATLLISAYARTRPEPGAPRGGAERRRALRLWASTLTVAVLALFWAVSSYAEVVGRGRAALTAGRVYGESPAVVVFSAQDLMIRGGGSCLFAVADKGSAYHYRYAGLRLLYASGDRLFLVPRYWSPDDGTLFVLREGDAGMRVEYLSGRAARTRECP